MLMREKKSTKMSIIEHLEGWLEYGLLVSKFREVSVHY